MQWSERTDGANFNITRVVDAGAYLGRVNGLGASFVRKANAVQREMDWITHRMGNMAKDHIMNNFATESFVDDTPQRWPRRKRGGSRPLLVKSGRMKSGIRIEGRTRNYVSISTPVAYAGIHNRPVGQMKQYGQYVYPGRQFMGHSAVLAEATHKMIISRLNMALSS